MRILFSLLASLIYLSFSSCMQDTSVNNDSTQFQDTISINNNNETNQSCFLHVSGTMHQDSTFVQLTLTDDSVEGIYNWLPYEKDSRKGTITGEKRGDTLEVVWKYMQEGMQDTLHTVFVLENNTLKQQPFTVNTETGREVLDKNAGFVIEYNKVACPEL